MILCSYFFSLSFFPKLPQVISNLLYAVYWDKDTQHQRFRNTQIYVYVFIYIHYVVPWNVANILWEKVKVKRLFRSLQKISTMLQYKLENRRKPLMFLKRSQDIHKIFIGADLGMFLKYNLRKSLGLSLEIFAEYFQNIRARWETIFSKNATIR